MKKLYFKNFIVFVVSILLSSAPLHAEEYPVFTDEDLLCGLLGKPRFKDVLTLHKPSKEALKSVEWLAELVGIEPNFKLFGAKFEPGKSTMAFAAVRGNTRYIVYDSDLMFISKTGTATWLDIGVMAHEITHHTSAATYLDTSKQHDQELEADMGAGHMLRLLGADRTQVLAKTLNYSLSASDTHPGRVARQKAMLKGWVAANRILIEANKASSF